MLSKIWIVLILSVLSSAFVTRLEKATPKIVIVGAGASGIAAAAKLLENGFSDIVILEAQDRIGGRVYSIPFGKGFLDLGGQWCEGEGGNVVYELVKPHFEFGDTGITPENDHCHTSDGIMLDQSICTNMLNMSMSILEDYKKMGKSNKSLGEYYEESYQNKNSAAIDEEFADQIKDFNERQMNSLFASESWYDVSAKLAAHTAAEGNEQLTWKDRGYKTVFDYLTKKLPDPSKALPVDEKIQLNKEVTNIDWNSNEVIVKCADGSEYRADHVIVTVSLGYLKKHHPTLFTPKLPQKKITAIQNTGFGTLGKIFLEFEQPFWSTDSKNWAAYAFLWKQKDKDNLIGSEKEWVTDVTSFMRVDAYPNLIAAFVAGKHMKQFEEISDQQLINDSMWLLEKFLGRTLPRPINMRRSKWMSNKYFLGSYSFTSIDNEFNDFKDLGEAICNGENKPILLFAGEATEEVNSGYVHGAVSSGWRVAGEIVEHYGSPI
ncbi:Peroxisomal N(1)-acetyl-spermine/spermidine oxidase [Pseudolycoriella hygida]|uniref:Amine oxidase n=1 Tax=Pseudolycoriella hygida TaxID=35572 RepID=A0A9Q0RXV0_9DIPT|nr:Peroxisomal N(1)-acetyl-spermine/spermidine oxidase [Pseudolycoriella hygida]